MNTRHEIVNAAFAVVSRHYPEGISDSRIEALRLRLAAIPTWAMVEDPEMLRETMLEVIDGEEREIAELIGMQEAPEPAPLHRKARRERELLIGDRYAHQGMEALVADAGDGRVTLSITGNGRQLEATMHAALAMEMLKGWSR